jgi:hypothetical protein
MRTYSAPSGLPWIQGGPPPEQPLWRAEDALRWAALVAAGFVMCAVGWFLAAGETNYRHQGGPANMALAGLIVAAAGHVAWTMRGRRAIEQRRRRLLGQLAATPMTDRTLSPMADRMLADWSNGEPRASSSPIVGGEGMRHYHRYDCPLAAGRPWPIGSVEEQKAAGRTPCGVCRP